MSQDVHGVARLEDDGKTLTITTKRKKIVTTQRKTKKKEGKKEVTFVDHVRKYKVEDICPDPRVAYPAYRLTTETGEFYDVAQNEWGATCSCPDGQFRRENDRQKCKHVLSLRAVGLLPKDLYNEESQADS